MELFRRWPGLVLVAIVGFTSCRGSTTVRVGAENVTARDFTFDGMSLLRATKGEKVTFTMKNAGPSKHELAIVAGHQVE